MIHFKFVEGTNIRLGSSGFYSDNGPAMTPAFAAELAQINAMYELREASRLFTSLSVAELLSLKKDAEARAGEEQADLTLWFDAQIGTTFVDDINAVPSICSKVATTLNALNAMGVVEIANPVTLTSLPQVRLLASPGPLYDLSPTTPWWESPHMGATFSVPSGINTPETLATLSAYQTGWEGYDVAVVDTEHAAPALREKVNFTHIPGGISTNSNGDSDHALASLSVAAGSRVDFATGLRYGTRGHAPRAIRGFTYDRRTATFLGIPVGTTTRLADAIVYMTALTIPGDVLLLEAQYSPSNSNPQCGGLRPVESDDDVYDALNFAGSLGRFVIEPAGNGSNWVGRPVGCYIRRPTPPAIMVGGAEPSTYPPTRGVYSNFGPRVDVAGPGGFICSAFSYSPIGEVLPGPSTSGPQAYSNNFNATSGASAVTAGAIASLSGVFRQAYGRGLGSPGREVATLRYVISDPGTIGVSLVGLGIGYQPDYAQTVFERILATRFPGCNPAASPPFNTEMLVTVGAGIESVAGSSTTIPGACSWRWTSSAGPNRVLAEEPAVLLPSRGPLDLGHNPGESYTVEARIRFSGASANWQPIVAKEYLTAPGVARNFGLWITPVGWVWLIV